MLIKNSEIELEITSMTFEGLGFAKYSDADTDGFAVFVHGAVTGDRALCRVLKTEKRFAYASCISILRRSELRMKEQCPYFGKCGGCAFGHITYEHELQIKKDFAVNELKKNFTNNTCETEDVEPSDLTENYRNKVQLPVSPAGKCGFFSKRSHNITEIPSCLRNDRRFDLIIAEFEKFIRDFDVSIYNEKTNKGIMRHLYIRIAHSTGEIMVTAVVTSADFRGNNEFASRMMQICGVVSVYLNINSKATNVILGDKCVLLAGKEKIRDILCGLKFDISPLSFYQVNSLQAEKIYLFAKENLSLDKSDVLLDLYCGTGTIGLSMADSVKEVIGAEIIPDAISDAKANAALNGITNARFYVCDAARICDIPDINPTVAVVDPPRKGLDEATVNALLTLNPAKIAYISCNPSTLSRDLALLADKYEVKRIKPFDMFPRTAHVETCAILIKKSI